MTKLLIFVVVTYALLVLTVYLFQGRVVFLANIPGRALVASPADIGLAFEDVSISTADGESLHGWYIPSFDSKGVVLFFHGNAGNISHRIESIGIFNRLGLDVLIIDYRGYGQSTGKPSESGLYADAEASWDYLVSQRAVDPGHIVIFGRSLGGAVGARLAGRENPGGLIVESTFTSGVDMAGRLYRFLPARLITRLKFPVSQFIEEVDCPLLVIHSRDDEIVPFEMGRALFEAASTRQKSFLELRGDHNGGFVISADVYLPGLEQFLQQALGRNG